MRQVFELTRLYLYKQIGTVKFWTPFILAITAIYEAVMPISKMTRHYSAAINGFSAAFIFSDQITVFVLFIGIFILFSDLPFQDTQQTFLLARSGKRGWIFSQVLYVILVSIVYFLFVFIFFCIITIPYLKFDYNDWGKIIKTIAAANASDKFGIRIRVSQGALSDFSPIEGFLYSFGIGVFTAIVLGMINLTFNLIIKARSGIIATGILIFMYMFVSYVNAISLKMFYFSPLGWCSLNMADKYGRSVLPDISFIVLTLTIVFLLLNIALLFYSNKKSRFALYTKEGMI